MLDKIFVEGVEVSFLYEIVLRSAIMFFFILCVLRLSGRRGVRQLTLFEVAIILGLGSAAGDPMFQEDVPILNALAVLFTVVLFYKAVTWAASRFETVNRLLEGKVKVIVREGKFDVKSERDNDFSKLEFFAELRNHSVEHLGQVRAGLLEVDGSISLLFYPDDEVKYGLPLFPDAYKPISDHDLADGPFACMYCGSVELRIEKSKQCCRRCKHKQWAKAIKTKRI